MTPLYFGGPKTFTKNLHKTMSFYSPEQKRAYYRKNRIKLRSQARAWWRKNKDKEKKRKKLWVEKNRDKLNEYRRKYYSDTWPKLKTHIMNLRKKDLKSHPWKRTYASIYKRCNAPGTNGYKNYGGRGIKNLLSMQELEFLWKRDGAAKMRRPSIDRIDVDDHYTLENCRYIEFNENSRRRQKHRELNAA